jgi:hypothetical protein
MSISAPGNQFEVRNIIAKPGPSDPSLGHLLGHVVVRYVQGNSVI